MTIGSKKIEDKRYVISNYVNSVPPSGIRKFFDLLASMEGVISLGVGEPDCSTPRCFCDAAIGSLNEGLTRYTSNSGMPELRQELARYLKDSYGLDYDPVGEILITVGVSEGLDLAGRAILNPGDEVIMPDPYYVAYPACVILAGGKTVYVPTTEENNFEVSAADIEAKITDKTRAILLGYPANPTGTVMPREKLLEIAELVRSYKLLVIFDEIYAKLVYDTEHTCFAALPGMQEHTILMGGFSKAYAMTGWRVGFAAAPKHIIAAMTKIHQYSIMCVATMSQVAAIEALRVGESNVAEMVADYNKRRKFIVKGLNDIGLHCFEPKGAFYAFPSIKSTGMTSEEFSEKLLFEEKVAVVPGTAFGQSGEGYVRCCYATAMDDIAEALSRMKRFLGKHSK